MADRKISETPGSAQKDQNEANTPVRRPGRPRSAKSGADKRELLLDAALKLFAQYGIAETPLSMIAKEAGVTTAMLHYYFKTREQLLDVMIDERFQPVRAGFTDIFQTHADDPLLAITNMAQCMIDAAEKYPWVAPLWVREVISESGMLKKRMEERNGDKNRKIVQECITRWQAEGKLNPDLNPALLFISLFGLTLFPMASMKMRREGASPISPDMLRKHVALLLFHGVAPQKP
ncbi:MULTISPECIES: TetR/AcrR family transcriptional regulator [Rahnella]|jgi:AcrR family transcriptional regulator|uniref:TetR/AcrR family transcriptional regulator n=1 Tax=Rahnella sp. (strain Y9602) TaxID=2703885 RepID=A0A0H3F4G8_RAHSY|nr:MULTISPECIES: TetR/AcrR family transcriptional regulator [Rahnella]AFE56416.1 TetR family transcriptional regulator [Rahnella aquatilis HX2]AYA05153.1 TetR/AcrR family transcriptional regulator [Rahnella aquatilis]ADW71778.1 transcriptional regulator, TetR family [Rahnella aceris]AZP49129.1 TetR/AcrR family transcriptional regulator [Rahnella aquatilis]MBU9842398.1 TetR/AcrR family transcriptional regulator [Rahnella aceris]